MGQQHSFDAKIRWMGERGEGTRRYRGYERTWVVETHGKAQILCSNDPMLGGDPSLHNPEDMLIASLSACHMLWYLHRASEAKISVKAYEDNPAGIGESDSKSGGAGRFIQAILRPTITLEGPVDLNVADAIHYEIHKVCFIARSVAFPVTYDATYVTA